MKKRLVTLIVAVAMIATMIPAMLAFADESAGEAPDYSKEEYWCQIPDITKDVDTIFIYQTEYKGELDYAPIDNQEMQEGVKNIDYKYQASVFEDSTNLFIPYYRQGSFQHVVDAWKETGDVRAALTGIPYDDITAALDYYFENYNEGRPFILAGHSQGSAICTLVLQNYFKEHPEYYDRLVVAYVIGFSVTKDELEANPHLKFATGENDTGVIVSWDAEGPENVEQNVSTAVVLPGAICINPLNWKLDDTYAPASENLGSLKLNEETGEYEIMDVGADAQVVPDRGVILTNADYDYVANTEVFGPQSLHEEDYGLYYNNLKDNVAKRIAAYQASDDEASLEADDSVYSFEDVINNLSGSGYDIKGLFDQIADLVEIFMNDGENETVGNIIRAVGDLVNTIINGEDTSSASSELVRDLIMDEDSLSQLSSGTILDIYEASRDELIERGIIVAE